MWPDRVSNPGPLTYESGALPTALRSRAVEKDLRAILFVPFLSWLDDLRFCFSGVSGFNFNKLFSFSSVL